MKHTTHDGRVSVRQLAALVQVSTDTIRRAYRKGELPAIRVRTALRFDLDERHLNTSLVFPSRVGTQLDPNHLRRALRPAMTEAGVVDSFP